MTNMTIRPIRTPEELDAVHACAKEDGHLLAWPSHVVMKDQYIVGSLSVMPMVLVWTKKDTKVRESLFVKDAIEAMLANQARVYCMPCLPTSPYFPLLPKDNFIDLGQFNLFTKGL